jgi:DNA-directed RNA polymerase specialized sigma24 family protein
MKRPPADPPLPLLAPALIETVVRRAAWLAPTDGAVLLSVYEQGLPVAEAARRLGTDEKALTRRIRRLIERVMAPRFVLAARVLRPDPDLRRLLPEPDPLAWPPTRRRVADAVVIRGLTMRHAAAELRTSLHSVRRHMDAIHAMANAMPQKGAA